MCFYCKYSLEIDRNISEFHAIFVTYAIIVDADGL